MSRQLINRSPDLARLAEEGYAIRIVSGHLIVEEIPYLDKDCNVRRGAFACPLDATAEHTTPPADHVMSFSGGQPHDRHGRPLQALGQTSPRCKSAGGLTFGLGFSNKPRDDGGAHRAYTDFYEKVRTYADIIATEVCAGDPTATAKVGALPENGSDEDPFVYPDSASARVGTTDLTELFVDEVTLHIGLGGTGGYVLDHVTKTPVRECRLIDGDRLYPHNTFRSPGAPHRSELQPPPFKVDYHAARCGLIKRNVVPHPEFLGPQNFCLLDGGTFAFVSMDPCPEKAEIVAELEGRKLPFVDVGMGLHRASNGIGGTLRAVLSTPNNREVVRPHIPLNGSVRDDEYANNIQISDLNDFNAMMALQLWKSYRGFYANFGDPVWYYQVDARQLIRGAA